MGRNSAAKNGLSPPIFVRLPQLEAYKVRAMVRKGKRLAAVCRDLIIEALEAREAVERNRVRRELPEEINREIERLREIR